jgi:hypothetical protein
MAVGDLFRDTFVALRLNGGGWGMRPKPAGELAVRYSLPAIRESKVVEMRMADPVLDGQSVSSLSAMQ